MVAHVILFPNIPYSANLPKTNINSIIQAMDSYINSIIISIPSTAYFHYRISTKTKIGNVFPHLHIICDEDLVGLIQLLPCDLRIRSIRYHKGNERLKRRLEYYIYCLN